jgi:glycosyltransferase involved in cell wall biosynthesis
LTQTPVITTIHGFSSPEILPVYKKYNDMTFYVSISDSDRAPGLDYVRTIYHGIDLKQFDFQPESDDYLLFFGRIHPDKGVVEAVEIAKACNKPLIIAGIIQDEAYYRYYIKPHLDNQRVIYIGSVGSVQRSMVLGKALALLHPIQFDEPFGLSVIEAMACGTPVVAFNRGSMPEIIEHGKNGFLVSEYADALEHLDCIKAINRADCRQSVVDRFTVDRMVDQYCEVYSLMSEKVL